MEGLPDVLTSAGRRRKLWPALALACATVLVACSGPENSGSPQGPEAPGVAAAGSAPAMESAAESGSAGDAVAAAGWMEEEGFVVWESRRTKAWRIWRRNLDGSGLTQLSPDEKGLQHCCAHISPDGEWVTYLGLTNPRGRYARDKSASGPLRIVKADGSEVRELAPAARTYFEHRAAVWRSPTELIYIDGDGYTQLLDLETGTSRRLISKPAETHGWLVNSSLSHATSGRPTFSAFREASGSVAERDALGGCQPYFSHDGRWGFWTAGAGGPIDRIDLGTGRRSSVLRRSDEMVPEDRGYLYFPMLSSDGGLLAVAGSDGDHSHWNANYDILVLPSDPRTLEVTGPAVQYTDHPAPDRFPDVWRAPMALGRHWGEAPLTVEFPDAGDGTWAWNFGDGANASGAGASHTFERPGTYRVEARQGETVASGLVTVESPIPPILEGVRMRDGGRRVELEFDESVTIATATAKLEDSGAGARLSLGADDRVVVAEFDTEITTQTRLILDGLTDRAQSPNAAQRLRIPLDLPGWPATTEDLAFLWETANAANSVFDPDTELDRTFGLTRSGGALLDRDFAMVLDHGVFAASKETGSEISSALASANEFTFEVTITPRRAPERAPLPILNLGVDRGINVQLLQRNVPDDTLYLQFRIGRAVEQQSLMPLTRGERVHVAVTYKPGSLVAYKNGAEVFSTSDYQKDFYHWDSRRLVFGTPGVRGSWAGTVQGVAIYSRALTAPEVAENHDRFRRALAKRPTVEGVTLEAVLVRASETPSLQEISPYREALSVHEYEVRSVLEGVYSDPTVRVARWSILDARVLPAAGAGDLVTLRLEPLSDNPQLESVFVSDTLGSADGRIFYAGDPGLIKPSGR